MLLLNNLSLKYKRSKAHILPPKLSSALLDSRKIGDKQSNNLIAKNIPPVLFSSIVVHSSIMLVFKDDGEFQKFYDFSFPPNSYMNDHILKKTVHLR